MSKPRKSTENHGKAKAAQAAKAKGEAAADPKPQADALKARLYELSTGELASRYRNSPVGQADEPLVAKSSPHGNLHYGPLAPQVGDLIAAAENDAVFAAPLFQGLHTRIDAHLDDPLKLRIVAGTVAWLRDRGHKIGGGWAQEIRQVADALVAEAAAVTRASSDYNVSLLTFMQYFCEPLRLDLQRKYAKQLKDAHHNGKITLPKHVGNAKRGQRHVYKAADLVKGWGRWREHMPELPPLKPFK